MPALPVISDPCRFHAFYHIIPSDPDELKELPAAQLEFSKWCRKLKEEKHPEQTAGRSVQKEYARGNDEVGHGDRDTTNEAITGAETEGQKERSSKRPIKSEEDHISVESPERFSSVNYSQEFGYLTWMGDGRLSSLCKTIISELFGQQNRIILKQICDDFLSNDNWFALALAYRLDQYIGWPIPVNEAIKASEDQPYKTIFDCRDRRLAQLSKNSKSLHRLCKAWADAWEAYWMCLLDDRERWGEDIEDIKAVLRRLLLLKYGEPTHLVMNSLKETARISTIYTTTVSPPVETRFGPVGTYARDYSAYLECVGQKRISFQASVSN